MSNCQCLCPQGLSKILPTPPSPHFDPSCLSAIFALPHYCHSAPVPMFLSLRTSDRCHWRGNPFPRPRAAGAAPLFTFASGGHLSFNSERKVRKNATKTYGFGFPQRATPCVKPASCSSRNRFSRVPLSVKRTVSPQLSAVALLPLPVATVGVSSSTAVTGREL